MDYLSGWPQWLPDIPSCFRTLWNGKKKKHSSIKGQGLYTLHLHPKHERAGRVHVNTVSNSFNCLSEVKFFLFSNECDSKRSRWSGLVKSSELNYLLHYPSLIAELMAQTWLLALGICLWHSHLEHMLHACHSPRKWSSRETFTLTCSTFVASIHQRLKY